MAIFLRIMILFCLVMTCLEVWAEDMQWGTFMLGCVILLRIMLPDYEKKKE